MKVKSRLRGKQVEGRKENIPAMKRIMIQMMYIKMTNGSEEMPGTKNIRRGKKKR